MWTVSEKGPNSEDLNGIVDPLAGLGAEWPETSNTAQSPCKKFKEAFSSIEAFEKHYLDLSHAAIKMHTSIGKILPANFIGKHPAVLHVIDFELFLEFQTFHTCSKRRFVMYGINKKYK